VVTAEEIAGIEVFAMLDAAEHERLARVAADVSLVAGEYAANAGDDRALFAVLEGRIEAVRAVDGVDRVVGERLPGDVFGEVPIVLGTVFPVGFRAATASRVLRIEPAAYHAIAAADPIVVKSIGALASLRMAGPRGL
jgi:thioredoxin reductase (NADPH)